MEKITINPHNCSREEYAELLNYLEDNSWEFTKEKNTISEVWIPNRTFTMSNSEDVCFIKDKGYNRVFGVKDFILIDERGFKHTISGDWLDNFKESKEVFVDHFTNYKEH